ncbi:hypothetical protein [Arthrobacter sp. SLBN-122]|uniref:hypothetical protein n=1 Tax=Arthrobacter sp. SLBN-122 TaxID=2768455 RepID=UPI00135C1050|nr:hypothetical protein [Arthrobacter sp. SLBN-122]
MAFIMQTRKACGLRRKMTEDELRAFGTAFAGQGFAVISDGEAAASKATSEAA